jgi:serine/threonine protein kinase
MEKKPVKRIGKYELIAKIAQGGMGELYKAKHPTLGRIVLLKKLSMRGGPQFTERFKREARLMMDFKNDHIVQVHDHFKEGPHYYIVEEFVDGISLDALIRRERYLSNEAAMLILYEVSKALKYAHDKKVIHRDIKPGNILISRQGEVKLVDFGIATSLEETEDGLTKDGMMLGTPAYVPPEQIENAKAVDRRADIYSLGVVLYEMLTGKTPFPGTFTAETINLIHKGRYTLPTRLNPKASPLLNKIVRKCMRVKPGRRYQDLSAVIRILSKRIKRKDPASIQQALKKVLLGKDIKDIFKARRSWLANLAGFLIIAGALGAAGCYLYLQGYAYEYLAPDKYGALIVAAQIDTSYKEPDEVFFKPVVYKEQDNTITRVEGIDFALRENPSKSSPRSYVIESKRIYLPAGRYRLKVNLEGQLYWSSFTLSPRSVQRKLLSTLDGQRITVQQGLGAALPLDVQIGVYDAGTGEDLGATAELSMMSGGRWVPWRFAMLGRISSGATYRFMVSHDGYYPQEFNLIVRPYQTSLRIEARLIPHAAALTLKSNGSGLYVLLNDSKYYFTGGKQGEYKMLEPLGAESRRISLSPGDYRLTVRRDSSLERTVNLHLAPDGAATAVISMQKDSLDLTIEE